MTKRSQITRFPTQDRGPPTEIDAHGGFHIAEELGPNMRKLPNGNLLCLNVPLARTGWMMYGPNETPIEVGKERVAYVERTADDLFHPKTLASFNGAAVVDEHPPDDVAPDNWRELGRGFAINIRRGEGDDADVMLGDLVITDKDLIESILAGKRQVSLGYDADYAQTAPGVGRQTNILGNHIALVDRGRCGPRCAIGDHAYQPSERKETAMTKRVQINTGGSPRRVPLSAQIASARQRVADAEAQLEALEAGQGSTADDGEPEDESGATHVHIHVDAGKAHANSPMTGTGVEDEEPENMEEGEGAKTMDDEVEARFQALEAGHQKINEELSQIKDMLTKIAGGGTEDKDPDAGEEEEEEEEGTKDSDESMEEPDKAKAKTGDSAGKGKAGKTKDSAALETSYKAVLAKAEILVPGFRMPTFDAAMTRAKTIDRMCNARRSALTACYATADGATLITSVAGAKTIDLDSMDCRQVAVVFNAAAGAKALLNNAKQTRDSSTMASGETKPASGVTSIASLNEANRKFWEGQLHK